MTLDVLFEDNHLLVVAKPAGLLVQGDRTSEASLLDFARAYRKEREQKSGNVYIGLVHRLDKPVSGVIVLAKTSKAAARLSEQFRNRTVHKVYLAVVEAGGRNTKAVLTKNAATWEDEIRRQEELSRPARRQVCRTQARQLARAGKFALLELMPLTGRKHQLRVQTANRGLPIVGDRTYGSTTHFPGLALHAASIGILHPTRNLPMTFACHPPSNWNSLGFDASDLEVKASGSTPSSGMFPRRK